jgi:hypothetical protein
MIISLEIFMFVFEVNVMEIKNGKLAKTTLENKFSY